jgi:CoA:oxalate CoA-transferase
MDALDGVRVLDLTTGVAGPNCTKLLADFGADVVKVEPAGGDPTRMEPPFAGDEPHRERSLLFLHLNTNKRSVTLDATTEQGASLLRRLAGSAQMVVEDGRPGSLAPLGLDYASLSEGQPALVYVSITPWGQTGPYAEADLRASELLYQGMGGPVLQTGSATREPLKLGGQLAQLQAGAVAGYAAVITLLRAEEDGEGDHIDISIYQTQAGTRDRRTTALTAYAYMGMPARRMPTGGLALASGVKPTADGYINLLAIGRERVDQLVAMIGREDLVGDPRLVEQPTTLDPAFVEEFGASYLAWLVQQGKREVVAEAQSRGLLAGVINTPEDLVSDPHYRERGVWESIAHPVAGEFEYPGRPFIMSDTPRQPAQRAPLLGEHTGEVLAELGVTDLDALRASGVVPEVA